MLQGHFGLRAEGSEVVSVFQRNAGKLSWVRGQWLAERKEVTGALDCNESAVELVSDAFGQKGLAPVQRNQTAEMWHPLLDWSQTCPGVKNADVTC